MTTNTSNYSRLVVLALVLVAVAVAVAVVVVVVAAAVVWTTGKLLQYVQL